MFDSDSNAKSDGIITNQFSQVEYYYQSPTNSYLNFPSHLLDDNALFLGAVLPYQPPPPLPPPPPPPPQPVMDDKSGDQRATEKGKRKRPSRGSGGLCKGSGSGGGGGGCSRGRAKRRAGKKDRHSKISTAHGPRDRRMRLSLQIARKFFDLQDKLGFDTASKTIEWLFNKSKAAIKDVAERSCTSIMPPSSPLEAANESGHVGGGCDKNYKKKEKGNSSKELKENRERARARARERTKEKLIMKHKGKLIIEQNPNSTSNVELQQPLEDQMASVAIIEKFLADSNDSSSCIFEFHHHEGQDPVVDPNRVVSCDPRVVGLLDFSGNWETENGRISSEYGGVVVSSDDVHVQGPSCGFNHIN